MNWVIIALNVLFLISLLIYFYRKYAYPFEQRLFILAVTLKILAGVGIGLIYQYNYEGGDTMLYYKEAQKIEHYRKQKEAAVHDVLFNTRDEETKLWDALIFKNEPRSMLFVKITFVFYMLAAGSFWLITTYYAMLSFAGLWLLYRVIVRINVNLRPAIIVAFFIWPSSVFWSSGVLKESLSLFLICIIVGLVLNYLYFQSGSFWDFILLLILAFVLWKLRYFYAAVLFPIIFSFITAYFLGDTFQKMSSPRVQFLVFITTLVGVSIVVTFLHPNLAIHRVVDVMISNYHQFVAKSDPGKYIEFSNLESAYDVLVNIPRAMFYGVFGPNGWNIGEHLWLTIAALENLILLCLFIYWLIALFRDSGIRLKLLPVYSLLFFVFITGAFLAFAAPNFGSLVRYKAGFMPFFIALILSDPRLSQLILKLLKRVHILPEKVE